MDEARIARLEARIGELEDERAIRELLARYGFNADLGREEEYAALWTEGGTYDFDGAFVVGRPALFNIVRDPDGLHKREIENRSMHVPTNLHISITGDRAWCECYSLVVVCDDAGAHRIFTAGYNHFDFAREQAGWRIERRYRREVGGAVWGGDVIASYLEEAR